MGIIQWFLNIFRKRKRLSHRKIQDVKIGEMITIEWSRIKGGIGDVKCLNNDPISKKIFVQVKWNNAKAAGCDEIEKFIIAYKAPMLKNFSVLNPINGVTQDSIDDYDISKLQKMMNEALDKEDYEKAEQLQKKIDKLNKK